MQKDKISEYKISLEKEQEKLIKDIAEYEKQVDFGSDIEGGDEEADEAEEMGNQLAIRDNLKNRLLEIEGALQRINEGKYGICTKCGKEISEEILRIVPESKLCGNCKKLES